MQLLASSLALVFTAQVASAVSPSTSQGASNAAIMAPADVDGLSPGRAAGFVPRITPNGDQGSVEIVSVAGGEQATFMIDSPASPHSKTFDLNLPEGADIVEHDGFFFIEQNGESIIRISKPWAKDRHGKEVKTWFTTDGMKLTQHVEKTDSAVYPIMADPRWNWGTISGHIYFSREETRKLAAGAAGAAAVGPFWLAVPPPFGPAIAGWWEKNSIHVTETATRAVAGHKCVQLKVGYIGMGAGAIGISPDEYTDGCS